MKILRFLFMTQPFDVRACESLCSVKNKGFGNLPEDRSGRGYVHDMVLIARDDLSSLDVDLW